jgi:hypothetical protein
MTRIIQQPWHQRVPPIRAARALVRGWLFGFVRKTFATDDGRRLLADALRGELTPRPNRAALQRVDEPAYPGVGALGSIHSTKGAVFITARFRSGSTLLWNLFRHVPECVAYYEPLNERRWFDRSARGARIDQTHRGVADYWREYDGLDALGAWFREDWAYRELFMDASSWDPELRRYIHELVAHAAGRPVLQFNRVDFRLPWLRTNFPDVPILHLYRHPRDQWCSSLLDLGAFPADAPPDAFIDHFYLLAWARDLRYQFPCLGDSRLSHPYRTFYALWRLSYLFGRAYAHYSLRYEDLIREPRAELTRLLAFLRIDTDLTPLLTLIDTAAVNRWPSYAPTAWFESHEAAAEEVLHEWLDATPAIETSRSSPAPAAAR